MPRGTGPETLSDRSKNQGNPRIQRNLGGGARDDVTADATAGATPDATADATAADATADATADPTLIFSKKSRQNSDAMGLATFRKGTLSKEM